MPSRAIRIRTIRHRAMLLTSCVLLAPATALAAAATAWEPLPGLSAGLCRSGTPFHAALAAVDLPDFRTEGFKLSESEKRIAVIRQRIRSLGAA